MGEHEGNLIGLVQEIMSAEQDVHAALENESFGSEPLKWSGLQDLT